MNNMEYKSVILASASPRRQELLKLIFEDFKVVPAGCEEILPEDIEVMSAAEYLSGIKCRAVAESFKDSLVIGCDTVVICGGKILGKPESAEEARRMLELLSGREHIVTTGVTVGLNDKYYSFTEKTTVEFYSLGKEEISEYIKTGEPMDKAGAYGIQGHGAMLVRKINGDFYNVVGLPVSGLARKLKEFLS